MNKGPIRYKTPDEIERIRASCLLVSKTLAEVASLIKPGITDSYLDKHAEEFILDHGAKPGFKGYGGFPATLCISINEEVVHGIPANRELKDMDIVSIDCGVYMDQFFGDAAYTFAIGELPQETMKLLSVTKTGLYQGIQQAVSGNRIGDIAFAVQNFCEKKYSFGVVRELVGHGIGKNLHESPEVPNFGRRGRGPLLKEGLVIAIEPMVNLGTRRVRQANDGWTIITKDKKPSAHFEHTVAVGKDRPDILSDHKIIEETIKKNKNLSEISIIC